MRSPCEVPGCKNSSAKWWPAQYLCSRHWPPVSLEARRAHTANLRSGADNRETWAACKREAIERAAGL